MSGQQHEEAHDRDRRPGNQSGDCGPHKEVAQKALGRAQKVDNPRPTTRARGSEVGVENPREDSEVDPDVLEDRDCVER
ncbi:hypothetical protein TorRG33x02_108880 [Trema orientale]|uniref:Uncharacterized protein n=1 Tax=Trema orientale TaxID=63057 RepID=A0A2P5F698_TREOI|nr:hypothetical protein TorRG33x02_108880 [Trema orientale]